MLHSFDSGRLEIRKRASGAMELRRRFPCGKAAVLSDGGRTGRPRKEVTAPRAFAYRVDRPAEEIHLPVGHSFDRPLASRGAGTLDFQVSEEALASKATIAPEIQDVTSVRDFLGGLATGLILGLGPGFRIPFARTVPNAKTVEEEDPTQGAAIIRTVHHALLYELSAVTRPAYSEAHIEERNWVPGGADRPNSGLVRAVNRWRA